MVGIMVARLTPLVNKTIRIPQLGFRSEYTYISCRKYTLLIHPVFLDQRMQNNHRFWLSQMNLLMLCFLFCLRIL